MKRILAALLLWLAAVPALGQAVQQSGQVTQGHAARWTTNGIIQDAGTAANGSLTSIGVTTNGTGFCQNSANALTATAYQQFCWGVTTAGGGLISIQNFGTATQQSITFNINGTVVTLPGGSGGTDTFATITLPITDGQVLCASGTTGNMVGCTPGIAVGGTGATTAATARTNLGLGTMATQTAAAVSITGGTINGATVTGLPTPSAASDAATKTYVDSTATGLHILAPSVLATAAVLPNTPTYANGASGVGATLTAGSNTTLTVDSVVATINQIVLVKTQATAAQNGQYYVSQAGDGSNPWILTRCTAAACGVQFNTAGTMLAGSYTFVTAGSTNTGKSFVLQSTVATVGTTDAVFNLFSNIGNPVTSIDGTSGAFTTGSGVTTAASVIRLANMANSTIKCRTTAGTGAPEDCTRNQAAAILGIFPNLLSGLTLSNNAVTPHTTLDIAAGGAVSDDATAVMTIAAFTKTTDAWVSGSGNGALDSGTVAAVTWYHVFLISCSGTSDILFSTSATSPTMPGGCDKKRRIGAFKTDASVFIFAFTQFGDQFLWVTGNANALLTTLSTTPVLYTTLVPTGVKVMALLRGYMDNASATSRVLLYSPDEVPSGFIGTDGNLTCLMTGINIDQACGELQIRTNTDAQIRAVASQPNTILQLYSYGWIDIR